MFIKYSRLVDSLKFYVKIEVMTDRTAEKFIKETIARFLDLREYEVFLFGSRASNRAHRFSDFDVGIKGKKPVPPKILVLIKDILEESDLPYMVDVVDFSSVSKIFKKTALNKIKKL